jgi:ATPase subunit of ABC transporter with duplicated ATPase domains
MNWVRTQSAYESMTAWREKRKAFQEKYEASMQNAIASLQTAWTDVGYNLGEIAANKAMARLQQEAKAKQEKAQAVLAAEQNQVNTPKQSSFSYGDSVTISGGATINLSSNTITHSDGTVVNLTTGLAVDLTA